MPALTQQMFHSAESERSGNLKLEHVFDLRGREHILDHLILDKELFRMPSGPYGVLTARGSITDPMRSKPNATG